LGVDDMPLSHYIARLWTICTHAIAYLLLVLT
jgi:hypothetical protein